MDLKKRAEELHHTPEPHYNCAQATLIGLVICLFIGFAFSKKA